MGSVMNRLSTEKRAQVVMSLVEGNSVRSTSRMTGVAKGTILSLLADLGEACAVYHDAHVRGLFTRRCQCDEVWSFCGAKQRNTSIEKAFQGWGDVWTWAAIDADSKLIVSYLVGQRSAKYAKEFLEDVASRVSNRIQLTTDGYHLYVTAVEEAFGAEVDYAMLIKLYGKPSGTESRYSPGECIGTEISVKVGNPDPAHISTSYVERSNLSLRMGNRRFTRLTNAFSKKLSNHAHMVAIYYMYYNYVRRHQSLRVSPAMEAGLSDHLWTIEDLVRLAEPKSILDGLMQSA
jgi:IS1 family transposase